MARFVATGDTPADPRTVFDYLADFETLAQWDPGIATCELISGQTATAGARYRVVAVFLGLKTELEYELLEAQAPTAAAPGRVVVRAETSDLTSYDVLTIETVGGGSRATYDADLAPKGIRRIADPAFWLMLQVIGRRAEAGLRSALTSLPERAQ